MRKIIFVLVLFISTIQSFAQRSKYLSQETMFYTTETKEKSHTTTDTKIVIDKDLMLVKITLQGGKSTAFKIKEVQFAKEENSIIYILDDKEFKYLILILNEEQSSIFLSPIDEKKYKIYYKKLIKIS